MRHNTHTRNGGPTLQIAYHIGASCTDGERLLKSLLKNADAFAQQGIKVPGPGKYRRLLRETIQNLGDNDPAPDTRDILIDAILDEDSATRLVMSHADFICVPRRIFDSGNFFELIEMKITRLRKLFPGDEIELHLALRDPATFVPAVFQKVKGATLAEFLNGMNPHDILWSDVVRRIQAVAPEMQLTVWCNEDTPLIWAQLIREISGVDPLTKITGGFDLLSAIMSADGMKRFVSYIKTHPPQTEVQKRRIIAAFLDKYALEDEIEEEIDLPGWTAELMEELTQIYEDDVFEIARMSGVNFIAP